MVRVLLIWAIGLLLQIAHADTALARQGEPVRLTSRVTDRAGLLTATEQRELEQFLAGFETETSIQIAVVILPSLNDRPVEDVSMEIFETNRIGVERKDNGVLLLVAPAERTVRIEAGYGLEGVLTDARSALILERELKPLFREQRYGEGLRRTVAAIMETTKGEYRAEDRSRPGTDVGSFLLILLLILFVSFLRMKRATQGGFAPRRGWSGHRGWTWIGGLGGGGLRGGWSGGGGFAGGGGATGRW